MSGRTSAAGENDRADPVATNHCQFNRNMKLNSLFICAASALLLCGACDKGDKKVEPRIVEDAISINPSTATVGSKGGDVPVQVTSSGAWSLSGEGNDLVTPSAMKGKDGDIVSFKIKANDQEVDRLFTYIFTCGKKSVPLKITLKKKAPEAEAQLEIYYPELSNNLPREGGKVTVLVTSSKAWTLEGESDFVTPSALSGEDGAEVVFDVKANETDAEKIADYTFRMDDKQVPFRITVAGGIPESIEITSKPELRLAYTKDERVAVTLTTNVDPRDLSAEITGADDGWLTWSIARPSESGGNMVTAYFSVRQNDGETSREASVKIKGLKKGEATLKVTQLVKPQLTAEKQAYFVGVEEQTLDIPVTANIEFDVALGESGDGWLTYKNYADGVLHFSVGALNGGSARECEVTLTEKNAPDNAEPVKHVVRITQKTKGLIEKVADMRASRCYFATLSNAAALNNLTAGTMEALVNIQETRTAGSISTIMGIEDKFLLRLGDVGVPWNQIQVATSRGNRTNAKLTLSELNRWYHIAVTWTPSSVTFYIDGKFIHSASLALNRGVNLGSIFTGNESKFSRAFWIGYSYNADRYFPGYMSEVRIWNRALSKAEINSENHFYSVPVNSEGLVGYWKLNEGSGNTVIDSSPSGNHMTGQINVRSQNGQQVGDPGMHYVEMSLP